MARIEILVDGKLALTTRQIGAELGVGDSGARSAIQRANLQPLEESLDARTPLYDAETARAALGRARPGRGAPGRPRAADRAAAA